MADNPDTANDREGPSELRAWVVRAGRKGEQVAHNLQHGVASIGWDEWDAPDLSSFADRNAYGEYIERDFQHEPPSERGSSRDQVWRFYHEISVGDLVVLPLKNHGTAEDWIAIGRVTSAAAFDPSQPVGGHHHRSVRWLASSVPKSAAPEDLQNSIVYSRQTVSMPRSSEATRIIQELADEHFDAASDDTQEIEHDPGNHQFSALSGDEAGAFDEDGRFVEGATKKVPVVVYERDPEARRICVKHHGAKCRVCGIDFGEEYGDFANGFIHVHHKTPVARAAKDGEYKVDPKEDLVPVCPNCHAMLHRHEDKPCTVETLRETRHTKKQTDKG
ncbi:HNH endonuclease [Candidatus Poriferisocius sp.]|uniref:HNH endonuclease n=1 Tax=Candidatus Poriferisocius sp. TaxID=3101276 RepID=UPI003B52D1C8